MTDGRPRRRQMNAFDRAVERVAASKAGGWYFVNVVSRIDPWILRRTDGRWSTAIGQPVLLVRNKGARSGRLRETALVYGVDGDAILLVASKAGATRNPAWYHNLKANPECEVIARDRSGRYRARELQGEEREHAWEIVTDVYRGYETYQTRTGGRTIPVLRLERPA